MKKFWAIFGLIFLAELPDKSAFTSVVLATRASPWAVFIGTALAFSVHTLLAVIFGAALGKLPATPVQIGAGLLFVVMGVIMVMRKVSEEISAANEPPARSFLKSVRTSFVVIFLAEWGDITQFAIAAIAAREHHPSLVFWASNLALWAVSGVGIILGSLLKKSIPARALEKIAGAVFIGVGALILGHAVLRSG